VDLEVQVPRADLVGFWEATADWAATADWVATADLEATAVSAGSSMEEATRALVPGLVLTEVLELPQAFQVHPALVVS